MFLLEVLLWQPASDIADVAHCSRTPAAGTLCRQFVNVGTLLARELRTRL
jgi:hypothetical protein